MNLIQKAVLNWMDEQNLGAIFFEGSYRFKEAFRRDGELADRFWDKQPFSELLRCMTLSR